MHHFQSMKHNLSPVLSYPSILRCCRLRTSWINYMLMIALSALIHMRKHANADDDLMMKWMRATAA